MNGFAENTCMLEQKRQRATGRLMAVLAAVCFGTESVTVQLCYSGGFNVLTLLTMRYIVAVAMFLTIVLLTKAPLLVAREYRLTVLGMGLLLISGTFLLFLALSKLPATLCILFYYVYPSLTALLAKLFFKQRLGWVRIAALLISALGLILLYWSSAENILLSGVLIVFAAALCHALKLNILGVILLKNNIYTYSFNSAFVATMIVIPVCTVFDGWVFELTAPAVGLMLYLALFVTGAATLLLNRSLSMIPAVDVSIICLLEPPVTALMALLIFNERLSFPQLCGGFLILLAVALPQIYTIYEQKRQHTGQVV
ncbi:MAG: EamA family transporter [Bacillota bacterium]|nr:EamA family transporter [Bacillota bacterium]